MKLSDAQIRAIKGILKRKYIEICNSLSNYIDYICEDNKELDKIFNMSYNERFVFSFENCFDSNFYPGYYHENTIKALTKRGYLYNRMPTKKLLDEFESQPDVLIEKNEIINKKLNNSIIQRKCVLKKALLKFKNNPEKLVNIFCDHASRYFGCSLDDFGEVNIRMYINNDNAYIKICRDTFEFQLFTITLDNFMQPKISFELLLYKFIKLSPSVSMPSSLSEIGSFYEKREKIQKEFEKSIWEILNVSF